MPSGEALYCVSASHVITAAVALSVVDIAAVALRFWTRKIQRQPPKADDWLMLPATLMTVGIGISQAYGVSKKALAYPVEIPEGFNGSPYELATPQLTLKSQIEWSFLLMFPIALGCIKASFLFFYMRIFATQKRSAINRILALSITFVAVWTVAFFFAVLFECGDSFGVIWSSQVEFMARCSGSMHMVFAMCITDFIADLFIILIPIPLVLRLNLSVRQKVGVCSLFLLGAVSVVTSLVRFIFMVETVNGSFNTSDIILQRTACMYWGMVECGIGVLAACLPTIQFLFRIWIWEPAILSTKTMFSSRTSRTLDSQNDAIYVDRTFDVAYAEVNGGSSRPTSPEELATIANEQFLHDQHHPTWDGRNGAAK